MLLAQGSVLGGFSLHLRDGCLRYVHNLYGKELHVVAADDTGRSRAATGSGSASSARKTPEARRSLTVDGAVVAEGHIPRFTVAAFSATGAGLTCGYELGPAVGDDYEAPFRCTATIHTATVTLSEQVPVNPMVEFERILSEQ